jgi:hypothetical protein
VITPGRNDPNTAERRVSALLPQRQGVFHRPTSLPIAEEQRGGFTGIFESAAEKPRGETEQNGTRATGPSRPGVSTGIMTLIGKARAGTLSASGR